MGGNSALDPSLFIGSSAEGLEVATHLQAELDYVCEPTVWTQGVFGPGGTTLTSLLNVVDKSDFAVLVATADDTVTLRGDSYPVARDNVIFELGLFLGALGPERVFIVQPRGQDVKLPSDLAGVTTLTYRPERQDGNLSAALGPCSTAIRQRIISLGLRTARASIKGMNTDVSRRGLTRAEELAELERELDAIVRAAESQGWQVKTRSGSALRLISKNNQRYSFPIGSPGESRDQLREFAAQLNRAGLRVSGKLTEPVHG